MATVVYADGTLATGDNDGTSWANAHQGNAGMQAALDAVVDGADTIIYVRNTFTIATTLDVDAGGGASTSNDWLAIIGCDAGGTELTKGSYVTFDADGNALGAAIFALNSVANVVFKHIYAYNTAKNDTEHGWSFTAAGAVYNFCWYNCKVTDCYNGWKQVQNCWGATWVDCVASGNANHVTTGGVVTTFIGCDFTIAAGQRGINFGYYCRTVIDCVFRDGAYGICSFNQGPTVSAYNTFHDQTIAANWVVAAFSSLTSYNNIYDVAVSGSDLAELIATGSLQYTDYNITNAADLLTTSVMCGAGANVNSGTIGFMDDSADDLRLLLTSVCINTGKPTIGSAFNTNQGYTDKGVWQRRSLINKD